MADVSQASPIAPAATSSAPFGKLWTLYLPVAFAVAVTALHFLAPLEFNRRLFMEGYGPIELSHFLMPLAASIIALIAAVKIWPHGAWLPRIWLLALAAGCFYIAGEEHSWGQHILGWSTPEGWSAINRQNETNLHNVTSFANHKPRILLELMIIGFVIVLPFVKRRERFRGLLERYADYIPSAAAMPVGVLCLFYLAWDHLLKTGLIPQIAKRESEMVETYMYAFLLIAAVDYLQRARRGGFRR